MTFKSQYEVGQLVQYENTDKKKEFPLFGFVSEIKFRKSDAVNYTCDYTIDRVNSDGDRDFNINENTVSFAYSPAALTRAYEERAAERAER